MGLSDLVANAEVPYFTPYAMSKATMNMAVAKYAAELKPQGVRFLGISPGWVATQEGLANAHLSSDTLLIL